MKTTLPTLLALGFLSLWAAPTSQAQYLYLKPRHPVQRSHAPSQPYRQYAQYKAPRQYMNRIAPQIQPPAPRPPANLPPGPAPNTAPPALAGTPTVESEKAAQEKALAVKRTVEFQKQRAEAGSPNAQYDLGKRYMTGDGVEKNLPEARKWLTAAAKQDHDGAKTKLEELKKLEEQEAKEKAKAKKEKQAEPPKDKQQ